ncbi:MAG: YceH family protein [Pirellulales bacterium]|nr:YceH family protein [Pirellulales bacterium]
MMSDATAGGSSAPTDAAPPRWRPLDRVERRIMGVLIEKAKTTPDSYPLSLNALVTGCNQKNNRHPVTNYDADSLEPALERLRASGAIVLVQGDGRVSKYRHLGYEWFGVSKFELAVLAELLLRGPQTEGELRGRADRMDSIPDLAALRPVVQALKDKKLIIGLSPEGRGHILTHNCYPPEELEKVRREALAHAPAPAAESAEPPAVRVAPPAPPAGVRISAPAPPPVRQSPAEVELLQAAIRELQSHVAELRTELGQVTALAERTADELRQVRDALGA